MPWFKVDDGFHSHAKAITAGTAALGLWVRCGSWSAHHLTDGFVPANVAREFGSAAQVKALVTAGLWLAADGGFRFNDFTDYNPTSDHVKAERDAAKERQRKAREAAKKKRDAERSSKEVTDLSRRDEAVTSGEVRECHSPPDPTRPDPKVLKNLYKILLESTSSKPAPGSLNGSNATARRSRRSPKAGGTLPG